MERTEAYNIVRLALEDCLEVDGVATARVREALSLLPSLAPPSHQTDGLVHTISMLDEFREELETQYLPDVLSSWPWANLYSALNNLRLREQQPAQRPEAKQICSYDGKPCDSIAIVVCSGCPALKSEATKG